MPTKLYINRHRIFFIFFLNNQFSSSLLYSHIQPYNIVNDLQQQKANISFNSFGQLFQISPKLRSDAGKSLRKPVARSAKFAHSCSTRLTKTPPSPPSCLSKKISVMLNPTTNFRSTKTLITIHENANTIKGL